ncbi:efflux RND transporter periplasmic adaptor subunit [Aureimonas leprariae]|uniref:HlyD family secretion protein n=1 Tax=Plantimonas leprariae TaxID=2615207 RepID=A0A7V7PMK0_9HYPH|nr:HlyD family secretion protein [Aureimonas leprariae]KAB0678474.1 HlyD family secretion protein [Aureimonas leprariae]
MKRFLSLLARVAVTLVVVAAAFAVGTSLWAYYMQAPWTRDGHVRADIVGVAPDVSGLVGEMLVRDNQTVRKGDVLFRVDAQRFALALRLAEAAVEGQQATLGQAKRDAERYQTLSRNVASQQQVEQALAAETIADANYQQALANRDVAKLNLQRSEVRAATDGVVTNLALNPGDYVTAGKAVMALVDSDSIRVEGYFEETKLPRIRVGDAVSVRLMGDGRDLPGHVQSIAGGIEDRERTNGTSLLANVTPTFSWVRLAQRVPVRVALDDPTAAPLVVGQTATVAVLPVPAAGDRRQASRPEWLDRIADLVGGIGNWAS